MILIVIFGQGLPGVTALGKPGNANGIIVMILISDCHDCLYHSVICSGRFKRVWKRPIESREDASASSTDIFINLAAETTERLEAYFIY